MLEQFKSLFVKLECLSGTELDRSAEKLVVAENGNSHAAASELVDDLEVGKGLSDHRKEVFRQRK